MFHVPEKFRVTTGGYGSDSSIVNNGLFRIKSLKLKTPIKVICSYKEGWDHVSVSLDVKHPNRCLTWEEMCFVKDLFWDKEDCVIQYHPAESEYVNCAPYVLHLWRSLDAVVPIPPSIMVGPK